MPQLSDSQFVVLTAACQRPNRCVFPVTARLKGNAAGNVLKSLLNKGLIKEVRAKHDDTVWRCERRSGSAQRWRSEIFRHDICRRTGRTLPSTSWWQSAAGWQALSTP